jgi:hypothetical protein
MRSGVAKPLNVSDHWPVWAEVALPIADYVSISGNSFNRKSAIGNWQ